MDTENDNQRTYWSVVTGADGSRTCRSRLPDHSERATLTGTLIGKSILAYSGGVAEDVFKALADPTRRKILDELAERSGQTLFELCSRLAMKHQLAMSRQAVSQHLAVLEAAGLVETRREGRYKFHDLNPTPLERIAERWTKHDTPERS